MTREQTAWACALLALGLAAAASAGPLPNVTLTEMTTKAPTCAIGDVVYALGEQFTGSGPCERCSCGAEGVRCARRRCEPRAGCKAVHRPDSCCPTYQCECEQEGRVYANGEKLVDPLDPCRVCYCQGGEVVCRRIACFVRDDCRPRLVPGRCCPEYDNCPLRGVSSTPGAAPAVASVSTEEEVSVSAAPPAPLTAATAVAPAHVDSGKPEITIKEITPVSEIPIVTDVKIKEVLPSQSIDILEYPSSKSPLITREATSESPLKEEFPASKDPLSIPALVTMSSESITSSAPTDASINTSGPSKITLSTLLISPSAVSQVTSLPSTTSAKAAAEPSSTRGSAFEEEDPLLLLDHNPAFPPIPDDLSVPGNHEDDMAQETILDGDHVSSKNDIVSVTLQAETSTTTTISPPKEAITTMPALVQSHTEVSTTATEQTKLESTTYKQINEHSSSPEVPTLVKSSPMLNLRSAIPTELLNSPLTEEEEINGELDEVVETTLPPIAENYNKDSSSSIWFTNSPDTIQNVELSTDSISEGFDPISTILHPKQGSSQQTFADRNEESYAAMTTEISLEQDTEPSAKIASISDLTSSVSETTNPTMIPESGDSVRQETTAIATAPTAPSSPAVEEIEIKATQADHFTVSDVPSTSAPVHNDNYFTTEYELASFGSDETSTVSFELLKITNNTEKSAPLIDNKTKNSNVLNDLIKLVGDVASISDHTDDPKITKATFSDSEELMTVNAGYKSKNNNWNLNSITEVPPKSSSKGKIVEIEDDEARVSELPAGARAEPTTRRPIIDRGGLAGRSTQEDIEIITKSYVPTINRRPTKVVMQNNDESTLNEPISSGLAASAESGTEDPQLESEKTAVPAASASTAPL